MSAFHSRWVAFSTSSTIKDSISVASFSTTTRFTLRFDFCPRKESPPSKGGSLLLDSDDDDRLSSGTIAGCRERPLVPFFLDSTPIGPRMNFARVSLTRAPSRRILASSILSSPSAASPEKRNRGDPPRYSNHWELCVSNVYAPPIRHIDFVDGSPTGQ
jgi:hypothetical protein